MTETEYAVAGIACDSCARMITAEIERIEGVTGVNVEVQSGTVTVTSEGPSDQALVRRAVEEAGYEFAAP